MPPENEAKTLGKILGHLEAKAVLLFLAATIAVVEARGIGDKIGNVQAKALVKTPADTPAKVKAKTLGDKGPMK